MGKARKAGQCFFEKTMTDDCSEGFEEDLYDFDEWPLSFTCFHATRAAAIHVELFTFVLGSARAHHHLALL